jgi:hypothetical protein
MDSHRLGLTTFAAVMAVALLAAAPAGARTCSSYRDQNADVVVKSREAVIWSTGDVFGCHRAARRARKLSVFHALFDFQLAGRYVAYYEYVEEFFEPVYVVVHVYDLVRGREKLRDHMDSAGDLVVKRNGSVAWIESSDPAQEGERVWEVHAISNEDGRGEVVLDRGTGVEPTSLALSKDRRTVLWRNEGERKSAPLR